MLDKIENKCKRGLYIYATYDKDGACYVKVGKSENLDKRLASHKSSAGSMDIIAVLHIGINTTSKHSMNYAINLHWAEESLIYHMKQKFGKPISGKETFLVDSIASVYDVIREGDFEQFMEEQYLTENLKKSFKSGRPNCFFIRGEKAAIMGQAGPDEKFRYVRTKFDPHRKRLPKEKRVPISSKAYTIYLAGRKSDEFEGNTLDNFFQKSA